MADHRDDPRIPFDPQVKLATPAEATDWAVTALRELAELWSGAPTGYGSDGPFADVSGNRSPGDPSFPNYLADLLVLHVRKNASYVGPNPDPLANYVNAGAAIGVVGYLAAFMRLAEKVSRLSALFTHGFDRAEDGEAIEETLNDIGVLAGLTRSLWVERR
jgi:hypothetical protein